MVHVLATLFAAWVVVAYCARDELHGNVNYDRHARNHTNASDKTLYRKKLNDASHDEIIHDEVFHAEVVYDKETRNHTNDTDAVAEESVAARTGSTGNHTNTTDVVAEKSVVAQLRSTMLEQFTRQWQRLGWQQRAGVCLLIGVASVLICIGCCCWRARRKRCPRAPPLAARPVLRETSSPGGGGSKHPDPSFHPVKNAARKMAGKGEDEEYRFGDISKNAARKLAGKGEDEQYRFGDISKRLLKIETKPTGK